MVELDGHSGLSTRAKQLCDPKPLHILGVVDRMQDASAAPIAAIWSNAPSWINDWGDLVSTRWIIIQ